VLLRRRLGVVSFDIAGRLQQVGEEARCGFLGGSFQREIPASSANTQ